MKIGIIQASSQNDKNALLFETVRKYACDAEVINFGCNGSEDESFSYIEISVMIALLLASGSVDFIVTGCSSGQGMMLACNSMPGVLCGYIPSPEDAYLFAQINNGNAVSLPLGEEYSWRGYDNFDLTLKKLFSEPFGQGYPNSEAERKLKDTRLLKDIRKKSQIGFNELFESLDDDMIRKVLTKKDVIRFVLENGNNVCLSDLLRGRLISNEK
ncbi:MAG: RpiB/LacA/LacB family sugar-phosphate isomerase [Saccharofermentans sp.]|nr:RpiB/LacA/LacB family sugar-phosphate isomerase [Saccharofermentans sp.]